MGMYSQGCTLIKLRTKAKRTFMCAQDPTRLPHYPGFPRYSLIVPVA